LAGGITGPTTSGALSLLAGNPIFAPDRMSYDGLDTRPLGGIFRRRDVSKIPPYDVLHIEEDLEWVTPAYRIEELIEKLKSMKNSRELPATHVTRDDIGRLLEIVESLSDSPGPQTLPMPRKVHVIILIGGLGVRMKAYTKEHSKAELPIAFRDQRGRLRHETILSLLVQTLAKTALVDDVLLLSSNRFIDRHRKLGEKLARKYKIKITVETDGGNGNANIVTVFTKQLSKYSEKADPIVLMVGDTLFSPKDIKELFEWVSLERPLAAVACSQVYGDLYRYGVIEFDRDGRIHKIWEKPGAAMYRTVSQGIYVFSPELRWRQLIANTNPQDIVGLFNLISDRIPVRSFVLNDPIYDCGSPEGYEKACVNGKEGKLW
jgi:dTDP-glucose pyrophosphorylase